MSFRGTWKTTDEGTPYRFEGGALRFSLFFKLGDIITQKVKDQGIETDDPLELVKITSAGNLSDIINGAKFSKFSPEDLSLNQDAINDLMLAGKQFAKLLELDLGGDFFHQAQYAELYGIPRELVQQNPQAAMGAVIYGTMIAMGAEEIDGQLFVPNPQQLESVTLHQIVDRLHDLDNIWPQEISLWARRILENNTFPEKVSALESGRSIAGQAWDKNATGTEQQTASIQPSITTDPALPKHTV